MQRFYAEQTGASWCVRDHEIITPFGPARGKPMLVQWCSGQAQAEALARTLNETRGHASDEPRCVECGAQPAGGKPRAALAVIPDSQEIRGIILRLSEPPHFRGFRLVSVGGQRRSA